LLAEVGLGVHISQENWKPSSAVFAVGSPGFGGVELPRLRGHFGADEQRGRVYVEVREVLCDVFEVMLLIAQLCWFLGEFGIRAGILSIIDVVSR
jgi:hypothetical protein